MAYANQQTYEQARALLAAHPLFRISLPSWEQATSSQRQWDAVWAVAKGKGIDLGDNPRGAEPAMLFAQPGAPAAPLPVSRLAPGINQLARLNSNSAAAQAAAARDICTKYEDAVRRGSIAAPRLKVLCEEARAKAAAATVQEPMFERATATEAEADKTKTYLMVAGGVALVAGAAWLLLRR